MGVIKNTYSGMQAAWFRRWKAQSDVDLIDQSIGPDGFYARDANNNNDIHVAGYDLDNLFRIANEGRTPARSQVTCHLYPNANMQTTPFFVNPTNRPIYISGIQAVMTAKGSVGNPTLTITHETTIQGTTGVLQTAGTGVNVMSGTFVVGGTGATNELVQSGTLAANYRLESRNNASNGVAPGAGLIVLQPGDMLTASFNGTLTSLVGLTISLAIAPGSKYQFVSYYIATAGAATTTSLMLSMRKRQLLYGAAVWQTAEATAGTLTLNITKDASGTAPGAGTAMLASTVNLKSAAKTYNQMSLSATAANLLLGPTDSVAALVSASATELAGLVVTLAFDGKQDEVQINYNAANSTVGTDEEYWIADRDYQVLDIGCKWSTISTSNKTLPVSDTGTQAPSAGQALITDNTNAGFDTSGTINVPVFGTLQTVHNLFLKQGDRLGIHNSGTLGGLAGLQLSVRLRPA